VIIQRCLGDLRSAGLVCVRHGAGAGWSLARAPEEITLLEVHDAVGPEPPFGLHHTEPNLECPVGQGIRPALSQVYGQVEQAMRRELAAVSVAGVLRETLEAP
jgi:DNA-binding IscR family transcriptional regulator